MKRAGSGRVCVIGAGVSGVAAAVRLQRKGYEVTVLERRDRVGGKCYTRTLELDGARLPFDLGATVVAVSYRNLLRHARALGERTIASPPYKLIRGPGDIIGFRQRYWPEGRTLALLRQYLRYLAHARRFHRRYVTSAGYRDTIPSAYHVPFARYCEQHGMGELLAWFELPVIGWGYGDPEVLPAYYVFGLIDLAGALGLLMTVTLGQSKFVQGWASGYGEVVRRLAERERLDVRLGVEVRGITRAAEGVTIEALARGVPKTFSADYVVISTPAVARLIAAPSPEEEAFLRELRYRPYATTLCTLDRALDAKLVALPNLGRETAVKMIASQHVGCRAAICYTTVPAEMSEDEVRQLVRRDLEALGIGVLEIHEVARWPDYFPRFRSFAGYRALHAAQGQNRTIYVGALNRFEYIEPAIATAIAQVDAQLPDLETPARERFTGLRNIAHMLLRGARQGEGHGA